MTPDEGLNFLIQKTIDLHAENLRLYTENMQLKAILIRFANKNNYGISAQDPSVDDIEFCTAEFVGTPWEFAQEELNKLQEK